MDRHTEAKMRENYQRKYGERQSKSEEEAGFQIYKVFVEKFKAESCLLTRVQVERIVREAQDWKLKYLVHFREVNGGGEHLEAFVAWNREQLKEAVRAYQSDYFPDCRTPVVIIAVIDLESITPVKLKHWISTFWITAPKPQNSFSEINNNKLSDGEAA